jgi:hypothetical protein
MPSAGAPAGSVAFLNNSTTSIPKATYVPIKLPEDERSKLQLTTTGGAIRKAGYVKGLGLQPGEVDAVDAARAVAKNRTPNPLYYFLRSFEGTPLPTVLPSASAFSQVTDADLLAFGNGLVELRQHAVSALQGAAQSPAKTQELALAINQLNTAITSTNAFSGGSPLSPIGMLNLERMEMTPAGIERGGLIATIPLAPKERTIVVQQEWSVISQDFTSIVTDSLDNYSATGVTDATQLGQSTTSQVAHNNQFNVNASVSGSYGFVTASVASQFGDQSQSSNSATDSRQHAIQTTKKASSRSIQSHKMTISTSTTSGTSNSNTRMLENPSATDPIRIDYFSIMRKWYVALYRYGLRLTYDITIPEPAAAMREAYRSLAKLQAQAAQGFNFGLKYSDITTSNYTSLASSYGAQVPTPPQPLWLTAGGTDVTGIDVNNPGNFTDWPIQFNVQDGFEIDHILLSAHIGDNHPQDNPNNKNGYSFGVVGYPSNLDENGGGSQEFIPNLNMGGFLNGFTGAITVTCVLRYANPAVITLFAYLVPTASAVQQWQASVYSALYNAAQTAFYTNQQTITAQISTLQTQINNVDTLTLRREENDEIMKSVLRWLLGDNFAFMPQNVIDYFKQGSGADLQYGIDFTGNDTGVSSRAWSIIGQNEDRINFISQAIDWDNVLYYVYSYFWDVPQSWDFIRQIQHPDSTRQAFLRAGSARVVLTVRKGWEVSWAYFVEFGQTTLPASLPPHPYLTIAEQIEDYDSTNYPGIPPADPNGGGPIDDGTPQVGTTIDAVLEPSNSPVTFEVADSTGFIAGATAIIDTWESGVQENQQITSVLDSTHITVAALSNKHDPAVNGNDPYPIVQAGESGLLIAEWFEYTPTSGTDIAVTSNLATIT